MDSCHKLQIDEAERRFQLDLEKAKALSLETAALDKFRQEKLKESSAVPRTSREPSPVYATVGAKSVSSSRSPSMESSSPRVQIKPRPRPGGSNTQSLGLVPPPIPRRQLSQSPISNDLINLMSPVRARSSDPEDSFLFQELDLAFPNLNGPPNRSSRHAVFIPNNHTSFQNMPPHLVKPLPTSPILPPPVPSTPKLNTVTRGPVSFDESILNRNLIDLAVESTHPRYSILRAFDPLLSSNPLPEQTVTPVACSTSSTEKNKTDDFFLDQDYDPFDYFLGLSQRSFEDPSTVPASSIPETIYEVLTKEQSPVKPATTSNKRQSLVPPAPKNKDTSLKVVVTGVDTGAGDLGLVTFVNLVRAVRSRFRYDETETNAGYVTSPMVASSCTESISVKLAVHLSMDHPIINFTCDISSRVDHVISHVVCELGATSQLKPEEYALKVWGMAEFLLPNSCLCDYEYVHHCIKLEKDVLLCLLHVDEVPKPLLRTAEDDMKDVQIQVEDLLSREPADALTHASISVLIDTIHGEIDRLLTNFSQTQPKALLQSVKALCSLLGCIETIDLTMALDNIVFTCNNSNTKGSNRAEIVGEDGPYSMVVLPGQNRLRTNCVELIVAIRKLMSAYTYAFRVNFALPPAPGFVKIYESSGVLDCVGFRVGALHRLESTWNFDTYEVRIELLHGVTSVGRSQLVFGTASSRSAVFFPNRIVFDEVISFSSVAICTLPRESRLVLTVYGRRKKADGDPGNGSEAEHVELGWTAQNFFRYGDPNWTLEQGNRLLPLWPPASDKRSGYVPTAGRHPRGHLTPLLSIEMPDLDDADIQFPQVEPIPIGELRDFSALDDNTQRSLMDIIQSGSFAKMDLYQRELLWEKRHYLTEEPAALTKVLQVAQSWDWASLSDLYGLLQSWKALTPLEALQLLLPCFPDIEVRRYAVEWLRPILSDELVDYLPQLVEALKLEPFDHSPLMVFLLERSLSSPQVAHSLYWLLVQQLPGPSPQNSDFAEAYFEGADPRYSGRLQLLLRSLLATCGAALRHRFLSEQMLVQQLDSCADVVKSTKESQRLSTLLRELEPIHFSLGNNPTSLPIGPSLQVNGLEVRQCSYFPSNTLPLKLAFHSAEPEVNENSLVSAMYKVGDDLRQDMLTLQMVRIMDKLWRKDGLDLKMVTFSCVPTGPRRGFVELVTGAETLRRIQIEHGLTGSFKDRPIADWLAKHNPSPLEYERAVHNFTASCAGYSVATYVFGVCDRHNDNIMVKSTGHLFHIDFGKFLGDAQMFGNFKRDRTPFVLTSDMAYVINGGDKPSQKFQHFVDLCCQAFNIVRQHSNSLLHLLALMATSNIPGVNADAISYVQKALLPDKSKAEAAAFFSRMIEDSLRSWFTQFNFFLHNLAQLRFHGDHNDDRLLSFVPKTFTLATDGRIIEARVVGFQKRYDPEKYYVFIVSLRREKQSENMYLFRTHREFSELHQKLCLRFPLVSNRILSLSKGVYLGRSSVKAVAEKRRTELDQFLTSLFQLAPEICHCDLIYTFFHPLLRDQDEEANVYVTKWRNKSSSSRSVSNANGHVQGELKLSIQYTRGELHVMIQHGRGLVGGNTATSVNNAAAELPCPYVKTYLLPDMHKITKRKTRVIRRNIHPTFMEMLVYRMPLESIQKRLLQVSVWSYDRVQENQFLGAVNIPLESLNLTEEHVAWYPLGHLHM
ncbi:hypothetical protein GHT06_016693 [Daphnia sinensis]|uniref:Phosphatidylinositol-4-phosphate 3-kinase n=1 Tax=Daphnia sinensis TaxID=1820382 RepID=A0AAD5KPT1_9CRUS|nr:hypothetical protein GHT06_016693 [Daphnia sinensis]